jgi:hypothetical protein
MPSTKTERTKIDIRTYDGKEPYLFISYSRSNTDIVSTILNKFDEKRFRIWYDDVMEVGADFRQELRTKIENCSAFVLFISKASMKSKYVGMEIITAYKNNKRIYPIYLEPDAEIPDSLKLVFEGLQYMKCYSIDGNEKYIDNLVASLPVETMHALVIKDGTLKECKDGNENIVLGNDVKIIGTAAFKHCKKMKTIILSEETEIIGDEAFRGCEGIQKIVIHKKIKSIGESAFRDCIALCELIVENGNIEISDRAFENCPKLEHISLPDEFRYIHNGIFNSCKNLTHINLPKELIILGENSFASCSKLKKISIPENTKK